MRDEDGYFFILGRTDDVINVAGHRLGTREIEEAIQSHSAVAEVAVIGVADKVKGQVPVGFCRLKDPSQLDAAGATEKMEKEIIAKVQELLGLWPSRITSTSSAHCRKPVPANCCAVDSGAGRRSRPR